MSFSTRNLWQIGFLLAMLILALAALTGCSGEEETKEPDDATQASPPFLEIVTTTDFMADWARRMGGSSVNVFSLLPPGADPHSFQPGSRDIARIADADLVLTVGLGLEDDWLNDLISNASADPTKVISVTDVIEPLENPEYSEEDSDAGEDHGEEETDEGDEGEDHADEDSEEGEGEHHDEGPLDPHFWFDPIRVERVIGHMGSLMAARDPSRAETYQSNAADYQHELQELHRFIESELASIPTSRRLLVTSHDSLQYFARRYGMTVVGTVIPSATTETESSPKHLTDLIEKVRRFNVPAVFGEVTVSERLAATIAEETGATLVRLYSGSLAPPGSPAETYVGMMRTNAQLISQALR